MPGPAALAIGAVLLESILAGRRAKRERETPVQPQIVVVPVTLPPMAAPAPAAPVVEETTAEKVVDVAAEALDIVQEATKDGS